MKATLGLKENPEEYERLRRVIELQEEDEALESIDTSEGDRVELNPASGGEAEARWYNQIFFSWLNPLLSLGRTRPLFMRDLGTLLPHLHPKKCSDELDRAWEAEVEEKKMEVLHRENAVSNGNLDDAKSGNSEIRSPHFSNHSTSPRSTQGDASSVELLEEEGNGMTSSTHYTNFKSYEDSSSGTSPTKQSSSNSAPKPSLRKAIFKTYRARMFWITLPRMWRVTAGVTGPLIVQQLIQVIENPADHAWYFGLMWAVLLFLDVFVAAVLFQHFCHLTVKSEVSLKMALNSLVYSKLLRLSAASKQESNIQGRLLSLVGSDTGKITEMLWQLPIFLLAPTLSLVSFFTVAYLLSFLSALAGFATLVILAPMTLIVAKRVETIRRRQSALTDIRIRLSTDIFHSMKTVKLYALEEQLRKKADVARSAEIKELRALQVYKAVARALYEGIIPIMFLTTIVTFILRGGILTPSNAFAVVSVYAALYWPFLLITGSVSASVEALISIRRFEEFLALDEQGDNRNKPQTDKLDGFVKLDSAGLAPSSSSETGSLNASSIASDVAVTFQNATYNWSSASQTPDVLLNINLNIRKGKLTCVVGPVGSGKSSLLNAILGELKLVHGSAAVNLPAGPIAYCPQTPFLMHMSIRDNILFGSPYDAERYNRVLHVSQLIVDLRQLVEGDHTIVGERGIALSGGQRSRVAMARAAYSKAELLLLDDPLSSLDSHVGSLLFSECLKGFLKDRTVVLVTHQLQYAAKSDEVIIFSGKPSGTIASCGSPSLLSHSGIDLNKLLNQFNTDHIQQHGPSVQEEDDEDDFVTALGPAKHSEAVVTSSDASPSALGDNKHRSAPQESFASYSDFAKSLSTMKGDEKSASGESSDNSVSVASVNDFSPVDTVRLAKKANRIAKEERGRGGIGQSVYKFYFRHYPYVWIFAIFLAFAHRALGMWVQMYVGKWSAENAAVNQQPAAPTTSPAAIIPTVPGTTAPGTSTSTPTGHSWSSTRQFLIVFTASSLAVVSVHLIKSMSVLILSVMTGKAIYREMEYRMLRGVMSFFDVTPKGRISSRLSSDTDALDSKLGEPLISVLNQAMIGVAAWVVAAIAVGWFALMFIPVAIGYVAIFNRSIDSFRDLTRLDGNAKSPVAGLIEETNTGLISIRSYRRQSQLTSHLHRLLDQHARPFYYKYVCDRWLAVRLSTVSALSGATIGMVGVINSKIWFKAADNSPTAPPGVPMAPTSSLSPSAASHVKNVGYVAAGLSSFLMAADVVADFMRSYTKLEAGMNSVERLEQYTKIDIERPFRTEDVVSELGIGGIGGKAGKHGRRKKAGDSTLLSRSSTPPRRPGHIDVRDSIRGGFDEYNNSLFVRDSKEVELDEVGEDGSTHRASLYSPSNPYQEFASFPSSDRYESFKGVSVHDLGRGLASDWPSNGTICFSNVSMRYRPGLPYALKDVSFKVRKGEKVGVVGRTGAGKSSLFSSILSLSPLDSGAITIDDIDIETIGVGDLRSKIGIISQEPVIFAASVRFNIDPFNAHTDAQLWQCLKRVHLDAYVASLPLQLDQPLSAADEGTGGAGGGAGLIETASSSLATTTSHTALPQHASSLHPTSPWSPSPASRHPHPASISVPARTPSPLSIASASASLGGNGAVTTTLSYGQRQLLCVARALLKNARILLLDEASSSIDLESDALLQSTLRADFSHCTIITIAHRLETILDSDRVLVMEQGRVVEFDSPSKLLANPASLFSSLHAHAALSHSIDAPEATPAAAEKPEPTIL